MKHKFSLTSVLIFLTVAVFAQDYKETLANTIKKFESDTSLGQFVSTNNRFAMIASKWNQEWAAQYYAAYGLIIQSYMESEESKRDGLLDLAASYVKKAEELFGKETDELDVMNAILASARLAVAPGDRWMKYGEIFNDYIAKAKAINPDNPRIYYLQGNNLYYTPKMFGGGAKTALPLYEKADQLYKAQPVADSLNLTPAWGNSHNSDMLSMCREELKGQE